MEKLIDYGFAIVIVAAIWAFGTMLRRIIGENDAAPGTTLPRGDKRADED